MNNYIFPILLLLSTIICHFNSYSESTGAVCNTCQQFAKLVVYINAHRLLHYVNEKILLIKRDIHV